MEKGQKLMAWYFFGLIALGMMCGCGASKKDLRALDDLLEKSKYADCVVIHRYLNEAHEIIHKEAYK